MLYDDSSRPFSSLDSFNVAEARPSAFVGGTTNARGDKDGTQAAYALYTVTGAVLVRIFGVCTTDLVGTNATLEVGIASNTAILIAQTTATGIDANQIWFDATPAVGDTLANLPGAFIIPNGQNIIETVATADITAGQIHYVCLWRPLNGVGNVVPAGTQVEGIELS